MARGKMLCFHDKAYQTKCSSSDSDNSIMYTHTISGYSGVMRIFMPIIDSPEILQLSGTLSVPFDPSQSGVPSSTVLWIEPPLAKDSLLTIVNGRDTAAATVARDLLDSACDLFLRICADGSAIIIAVLVRLYNVLNNEYSSWHQNIDGRPPKLLRQFIVRQHPPGTLPLSDLPSFVTLNSHPSQKGTLILISDSPLSTISIPASFLVADISDVKSVMMQAITLGRTKEYHNLDQLVDSIDGKTVGSRHSNGDVDVWSYSRQSGLSYEYAAERVQLLLILGKGENQRFHSLFRVN